MKDRNHQPAIELFCSKYIEFGFNGAAAYRALHPAASANTAAVEACRLLRKPKVQETLRPMVEATLSKAKLDREWVVQRLLEEANASPLDYFEVTEDGQLGELAVANLTPEQRRNLKSIKVLRSKRRKSITVTVHDQQHAVGLIAKMLGMIDGQLRHEREGRVGDIIERGVKAIRKHRDVDAWKKLFGER